MSGAIPAGGSTAAVEAGLRALAAEIHDLTGVRARIGERLAPHTTIRVGGPADLLVAARDVATLAAVVAWARARPLPHVVIGRGSDLVVSDAGIRGLVVLDRAEGCSIEGSRLIAEAGLALARAATLSQRAGLAGLEFGLSIPGTVGGAIWANAGAHGSDVAAVLESVTMLDRRGELVRVAASELGLAYRDSRFKRAAGKRSGESPSSGAAPGSGEGGRLAGGAGEGPRAGKGSGPASDGVTPASGPWGARVSGLGGAVTPGDAGQAWPELILRATFLLRPAQPAELAARLAEIRRWRREHQPLRLPSAGSVFRNPPGDSAGRLIEACGLKGARVGGAVISELHANFIVNAGGATATQIRTLGERARADVAERFGVRLDYEVEFMGDWSIWQQEDR